MAPKHKPGPSGGDRNGIICIHCGVTRYSVRVVIEDMVEEVIVKGIVQKRYWKKGDYFCTACGMAMNRDMPF